MKIEIVLSVVTASAVLMSCTNQTESRKLPVSSRIDGPISSGAPVEMNRSPISTRNADPISAGIYAEVNGYRKSIGVAPLQRHAGLDKMAMQFSEYLRQNRGSFSLYGTNVSHMGSSGRSMMAMRIYGMSSTSENVASMSGLGSPSADAKGFLKLWKESPIHREALKNAAWTHTGIGTVTDADGTVFSTELFGSMTMTQMVSRERFR
jgi:uncharacterized protein YkwD